MFAKVDLNRFEDSGDGLVLWGRLWGNSAAAPPAPSEGHTAALSARVAFPARGGRASSRRRRMAAALRQKPRLLMRELIVGHDSGVPEPWKLGVVTLRGSVHSWHDRHEAEKAVWADPGGVHRAQLHFRQMTAPLTPGRQRRGAVLWGWLSGQRVARCTAMDSSDVRASGLKRLDLSRRSKSQSSRDVRPKVRIARGPSVSRTARTRAVTSVESDHESGEQCQRSE
jgi:hypothetical protein